MDALKDDAAELFVRARKAEAKLAAIRKFLQPLADSVPDSAYEFGRRQVTYMVLKIMDGDDA